MAARRSGIPLSKEASMPWSQRKFSACPARAWGANSSAARPPCEAFRPELPWRESILSACARDRSAKGRRREVNWSRRHGFSKAAVFTVIRKPPGWNSLTSRRPAESGVPLPGLNSSLSTSCRRQAWKTLACSAGPARLWLKRPISPRTTASVATDCCPENNRQQQGFSPLSARSDFRQPGRRLQRSRSERVGAASGDTRSAQCRQEWRHLKFLHSADRGDEPP